MTRWLIRIISMYRNHTVNDEYDWCSRTITTAAHFPEIQRVVTKQAAKKRLDVNIIRWYTVMVACTPISMCCVFFLGGGSMAGTWRTLDIRSSWPEWRRPCWICTGMLSLPPRGRSASWQSFAIRWDPSLPRGAFFSDRCYLVLSESSYLGQMTCMICAHLMI